MNPVQIGTATLYLGDCLDVMPMIAEPVDAIICDLPYGTTQCAWDAVIPFDQLWERYRKVAKENAAVVLFSAQPFTSLLVASNLAQFRYEWIWEKGNATGFLNAKKQPLRAHENAMVFYERQPTYNPQFTSGHERKTANRKTVNSECYGKALDLTVYDSDERYPRDVQFFSSDKQKANYHPTQKPVQLMEYLTLTYTNAGDVVLDNCMGSGTAGVAAVNQGRRFIGIERDPRYFDIACSRIKQAVAQGKLFDDPEIKQEQGELI